jgi:hypothetical protein
MDRSSCVLNSRDMLFGCGVQRPLDSSPVKFAFGLELLDGYYLVNWTNIDQILTWILLEFPKLRCQIPLSQKSSHHRLNFNDFLHLGFIQSRQVFLIVVL